MTAPLVRPKIVGRAAVKYPCHLCGKPIEGTPTFTHIDGRLVALHPGERNGR
jgi:hypothetical protein